MPTALDDRDIGILEILAREGRISKTELARRVNLPATPCWALGGAFDYLLLVVATDIDSYQRLMDDLLGARIGLKRYFTYIVTKGVKSTDAPPLELLLDRQRD